MVLPLSEVNPRYNSAMTADAQKILDMARQLPPSELDWLIGSLEQVGDGSTNDEIETAWKAEVERRASEADAGRGETYSWQEVEARLRARLDK